MNRLLRTLLVVMLAIISIDSYAQVPNTPKEKREAILTPQYYTPWIGASFFTIPTVEHEFEVEPVQIKDLVFFYDLGECIVGMEANRDGVVIQMTFRLFGDKATRFLEQAMNYGYEKVGEGADVNVRTNTGKAVPDLYESNVEKYRMRTQNGSVYIEVSNSASYANEYQIAIYRTK